jgi:uncharacterized low-complexity protein
MMRPIDLQTSIFSAQNTPAVQRTEQTSRVDAQAGQAAFAAEVERSGESVAAATEAAGSRIGAKPDKREAADKRRRRARKPSDEYSFDDVVDEAAGSEEPAHIVDFTA